MAKWIWYPGDFEIYHSMLLHDRREEFGVHYPCMWHICRPEFGSIFEKAVTLDKEVTFRAYFRGRGCLRIDGKQVTAEKPYTLSAGKHHLSIPVTNTDTFPALYIDAEGLSTDESWTARRFDAKPETAACNPAYPSREDDPAVFPFSYQPVPVSAKEAVGGGILYDFGTETFGPVTVQSAEAMGDIFLCYGESREEALDFDNAIVFDTLPAKTGSTVCPPRAFRFLFVRAEQGEPSVSAELEYLPIPDIASFSCDDEKLEKIWEICVRTFHLNSREFYLDGIKRDRWCWSGDAYQSYIVNRYLYFEPSIIRRTIRALLGKQPILQHTNTINDYSALLIIAVWEYYFSTGDKDFVLSVLPEVDALYGYILSRLDPATGYVVQRPGDWIFIDWADIDKDGPLCAEQILLWQAHNAMARFYELRDPSAVVAENPYKERAEKLKASILHDFWDEERAAFIDSYTSGRKNVTRHANIFAILYDFVDRSTAERIAGSVLRGTLAKPITTPYFKFFELMALGKMGDIGSIQKYIDEYWGGMAALGATTVWERFDPTETGIEHYAMYGMKYGCSLCHAWGSGPIALLGMYCAGVTPTDIGYRTFDVRPNPGNYGHFSAVVPLNGGTVTVIYENGAVRASATIPGGTLYFGGKTAAIPVNGFAEIKI